MFSIIIPVFGISRVEYFKVFLDSYRRAGKHYKTVMQSGDVEPIELIVVEMVHPDGNTFYNHLIPPTCKYKIVKSFASYERSRLFNVGVSLAKHDWLVFHDVDVPLPKDFFVALDVAISDGALAFSNFYRFLRMSSHDSDKVFSGRDAYNLGTVSGKVEKQGEGWTKLSCTIQRSLFCKAGGWHEGFIGWGLEDDEFSRRLEYLGHRMKYVLQTLRHLWHPLTSPNWEKPEASKVIYNETLDNASDVIDELRDKLIVNYGKGILEGE